MTVQAHVDPAIRRTWPAYEAAVVIAENVRNGPTDEASEALLAAAERAARESGLERAADDPRIAAWRAAFSEFGSKPSRYPCSAEALLARVLKGEPAAAHQRARRHLQRGQPPPRDPGWRGGPRRAAR